MSAQCAENDAPLDKATYFRRMNENRQLALRYEDALVAIATHPDQTPALVAIVKAALIDGTGAQS